MDYRFCISLGIKKYTMQGGGVVKKKNGGGGCEKNWGEGVVKKIGGRGRFFFGGGGELEPLKSQCSFILQV